MCGSLNSGRQGRSYRTRRLQIAYDCVLRLHVWVEYFDDLARLDGGQNLNDLRNHCDMSLESVVRCPDDDDRNRPPLHRLLSLDSFVGGDQDGESGLLSFRQQRAILQCVPCHFKGCADFVAGQMIGDPPIEVMVE